MLAAAVARKLALPLEDGLVRLRATATQVSQDRAARWENVAGAFAWVGQPLEGTVLLVDDVVTTGATVIAASEALITAGARAVIVLALARAAAV
nr:phosphoribosyltransferase family protein [Thermomicrobium sp. CFH 73360]